VLLRIQSFPLVFTSQLCSLLADQFYLIALPWIILQITGSPLAVGSTFALAALPRALFLPIGGVWADRQGPRRIMVIVSVTRCLVLIGLIILLSQDVIWGIYPAALLLGTAAAFYYPAEGSILPRIVPKDLLQSANGLVQGANQLIGIVGPALGGVAVSTLGSEIVLAVAALSYLGAALLLWPLQIQMQTYVRAEGHFLSELLAGARRVWGDPALRRLLLTIALVNLGFVGPFNVGLPALVQGSLGLGAEAFGLLAAAFSIGALSGVFIATLSGKINAKGRLALGSVLVTGLGFGSLGVVSGLVPALGLLAVAGIGSGLANVILITLLQLRTSEDLLGRVMSLVLVSSFGLAPLSQFLAGVIAEGLGVQTLFPIGACIMLLALVLGGRWIIHL
jgi:MFS family permease